ncbi:MAG TPA: succinylglutamate desuccinylase/aspartoacylase family protein [Saprospiraceae bacterium]|nr:succinylglutamate desuccinylase/aspartoacylase family protein [Saprospiraceae bacterium]
MKNLVLNKQLIKPGQEAIVKLDVGRLHSGTRIVISLFVYRSEYPGPTALIMGGVHGDEINGVEIVRRAIDNELFKNLLAGTVIAIPVVNVYGFINFSRDIAEGKDVNRNFPGSRSGSLASRIAHLIARSVLPDAHVVVDFHTGGASRYNYPQVRYTKSSPESLVVATHFAPRFILEKPVIRGSLRKVARDANVPMIVYEGGEALRLDGFAIDRGLQGMRRLLAGLGMIGIQTDLPPAEASVHVQKCSWLRASRAGIFTWTKSSGACVTKGEPLALITDPYGTKTIPVLANKSGFILAHNNAPIVHQGDALFNIAYQFSTLSKPLQ